MLDALIVGAGPAGSTTARLLARAGWKVALVEKAEFPRRKVCGEFISAPTMPIIEACGIGAEFLAAAGPPVTHVGLYAGNTMLFSSRNGIWGRALGREHLDTLLRNAAMQAGSQLFQPAQVMATQRTAQGHVCTVRSGNGERQITARIVVAACGSWNNGGIFAVPSGGVADSDLFAFKAHFADSCLPSGLMPLLAFPGGYGGLVHSDGGRTSLSCCIRRDALAAARQHHGGRAAEATFAHIVATTDGVREALNGAVMKGAFLSTGPIRPGIRSRYRDGLFFVGNIAGEAHPVIAEGISMAIQSSSLLAGLLIAGRGKEYSRAWRRCFGSRIHAASLFSHLAIHNGTRAASVAVIRKFPALFDWGARFSGKRFMSA